MTLANICVNCDLSGLSYFGNHYGFISTYGQMLGRSKKLKKKTKNRRLHLKYQKQNITLIFGTLIN